MRVARAGRALHPSVTKGRRPSAALVTATALVAAVCGLGVLLRPIPLPIVSVHLAQLALAGAAAFVFDDAAAELTGVTPRPLWLRRAPRVVAGLAVLAGTWVMLLLATGGEAKRALTLEACVLVVLALSASGVVAVRGDPEPGTSVASTVVLAGAGVMLVGGWLGTSSSSATPRRPTGTRCGSDGRRWASWPWPS